MVNQLIPTAAELPDIMLIDSILAGEKKLFEFIMRRYNQRLFRIGMSILDNAATVEDVMQNAYINAYEHLSQFEKRASFGTWLTRIMLNECLRQKKLQERFKTAIQQQPENKAMMTTPAYVLANKELSIALEEALSRLPEKYRLVFMLREMEEMSVKETAEALGIEASNVKVRLNRAKIMLRDSLNNYMKDHVYAFHLTRCDRVVTNVLAQLGIG